MAETLLTQIKRSDTFPYMVKVTANTNSGYISIMPDNWTPQMFYELPSIKFDIYVDENSLKSKYNPISITLDTYTGDIVDNKICSRLLNVPETFYICITPLFDGNAIDARNMLIENGIEEGTLWDSKTDTFPIDIEFDDSSASSGGGGGGGGGGGSAVLIDKTITENGEYAAVDDNADGYSVVVVNVPSGGGGSIYNMVTLSDYDGTVIAQYTPQQFAQLESYPTPPSHDYLTFTEYNWTLSNAKTYVAKYGSLNIGATYNTSDGKTRMFVTVRDGRLNIGLQLGVNGTVDIDWGDGSAHDTMSGSDVSTTQLTSHAYSIAGDYIIALAVSGSVSIFEGFLCEPTGVTDNRKYVYRSILNSIFIGNKFGIGLNVFSYCCALTSITIPDTVTSILNYAFNNCFSLTSITIPDTVTGIGSFAFGNCYALTTIIPPDTVTSIGSYAFNSCCALASITIPDTVTNIVSYAFNSCFSLTSVAIPDTVTNIWNNAFNNCHALTSVTIPDTVTSIGSNAFGNCYGLGYIRFGSETPPTVSNSNAFSNIPSDCIIYVPSASLSTYKSKTNYPSSTKYTYIGY